MAVVQTGYPYQEGAPNPFLNHVLAAPDCPICSGRSDPNGPAAQALRWGVLTHQQQGGDDFWSMASIAEVQHQAGGQDHALQTFVDGCMRVASERRGLAWLDDDVRFNEGEPAEDDPKKEEEPKTPPPVITPGEKVLPNDWIPWPERDGSGKPLPGGDDGSDWSGKGTCCPKPPFHYPVPGKTKQEEADVHSSHMAFPKFVFEVEANFDKIKVGCICECCVFRQRVLENNAVRLPDTPNEGEFRVWDDKTVGTIDCLWILSTVYERTNENGTKSRVTTHRSEVGGQDAPPATLKPDAEEAAKKAKTGFKYVSHSYAGPYCAGGKAPWPEDKMPKSEDHRGEYSNGACKYTWKDTPQAVLGQPGPYKFRWNWKSEGVILDRCHGYVLRDRREWTAVWLGSVSSSNDVTMELVEDTTTGGAGSGSR